MAKVIIKNAVISYPHIFKPEQSDFTTEAKYTATLLIDKTNEETLRAISLAIKEAGKKAMETVWKNIKPAGDVNPLRDGDGTTKNGSPYGPECKNRMVLRTSTKRKPQVLDMDKTRTESEEVVYAGCRVHASVEFYGFNVNGNKGICAQLGNIMKAADAERLGGAATAEEDFADIAPIPIKKNDFGIGDANPFDDPDLPF